MGLYHHEKHEIQIITEVILITFPIECIFFSITGKKESSQNVLALPNCDNRLRFCKVRAH